MFFSNGYKYKQLQFHLWWKIYNSCLYEGDMKMTEYILNKGVPES